MYDGLLEINDACMRLSTAAGEKCSPAVTLLENNTLVLGDQAYAQARLKPLQINSKFVQQLNTIERSELAPHARHHADLAHKLLVQMLSLAGDPPSLVFAVPSNYNDEQLSLLLGVAAACSGKPVGLVDTAVAAVSGMELSGSVVYCQMQLHQTVLTELIVQDGRLKRGEVICEDGMGKEDLLDRLLHIVADAFVEQCRFDPLHEARVEQLLVTQIEAALFGSSVSKAEYIFELEEKYRARLASATLFAVVKELEAKLLSRSAALAANAQVVFCPLLSELPLSQPQAVLPTESDLLAKSVRAQSAEICSSAEHLPFVFSLPLLMPLVAVPAAGTVAVGVAQNAASSTANSAGDNTASHFLLNDEAVSIAEALYFSEMGRGAVWSTVESSTSVAVLSRQDGRTTLRPVNGGSVLLNGLELKTPSTVGKGDEMQLSGLGSSVRFIKVL